MSKKKVLIITYYWPPAGGPGVQRWLKFVKYLPEFDIEPIVYCPENPVYPQEDKSLLAEISPEITVLKQSINEPYKLANFLSKKTKTISKGIIPEEQKQGFVQKAMLYIRGNFFIPDARKNWIKPSVNYLSSYIEANNIKTIITTGPPHSLHLIGLELKNKLNIKWIADFRDPWTTISYHKQLRLTEASKKKHKVLESNVLNSADSIIVTSNVTKTEFLQITKKPITVITNGYDDETEVETALDSKFTIAHIGSLLSKRNPKILWKALQELTEEHEDFANEFQLNLVGSVSEDVLKTIKLYNLTKYLNEVGYVSHNKSIEHQKKSQILLLIEINSEDTKAIIPGKLFEYLVSKRPIIAFGPQATDVEKIIKKTNAGDYFYYTNFETLKAKLLLHFKNYKEGNLHVKTKGVEQYSRKNLTKILADSIKAL